MPKLEAMLGGAKLWVKRDDCTGLAFGGNKTRKLDYLLGEALAQGADTLVTQGAVQSNHVRQTAAAACRFGLRCSVLLERRVPDTQETYEHTGNVFLDQLFGAAIAMRPPGLDMNAEAEVHAQRLRDQGAKPYVIPGGGSNAVGALGYVECATEMLGQANHLGLTIDWVVHGTGSTGTQAGLVAGLEAANSAIKVLGISVRQPRDKQEAAVHDLASEVADKLSIRGGISRESIIANSDYVGAGYGIPTHGTLEAIRIAAQQETLLLDPVYSGKAMDGLIDLSRNGFFNKDENVVFLHTGGSPALFAYQQACLSG